MEGADVEAREAHQRVVPALALVVVGSTSRSQVQRQLLLVLLLGLGSCLVVDLVLQQLQLLQQQEEA